MYTALFDKELLQDWCDHCEGKKKFDSFHFSTLLMETMLEGYTEKVDQFYKEITKYFDSSIYENLKYCMSGTKIPTHDIWTWVERDLNERKKIFSDQHEASIIAELTATQKYRIVHDHSELDAARRSDLNTILYETSSDYAIDNQIADDRLYALDEMFYNIACDYDLVRALMSGVISGEVDFSNYTEIYRRGSDYAVNPNEILIFTPKEK